MTMKERLRDAIGGAILLTAVVVIDRFLVVIRGSFEAWLIAVFFAGTAGVGGLLVIHDAIRGIDRLGGRP